MDSIEEKNYSKLLKLKKQMIILNKIEATIQNGDLVVTNIAGTGPHTVQLTISDLTNSTIVHNSTFTVPGAQTIVISGFAADIYLMEFEINKQVELAKLIIPNDPSVDPILKPHETGIIVVVAGRNTEEQAVTVEPTTRIGVYGKGLEAAADLRVRVKILTEDGEITKFDEEFPVAPSTNSESFSISTAEYPAGTYILSYESGNEEYIVHSKGILTFVVE